MNKVAKLKAQRLAALEAAKALTNQAQAENRDLTDDETVKVKQHMADAKAIEPKITEAEADAQVIADLDAQHADATAAVVPRGRSSANAGQPGEDAPSGPPARGAAAGPARNQPATVRNRAEADPTRGFRHVGAFAMAVAQAMTPGLTADQRLAPLASVTGMGQTVGADGGFLVPPQFATSIWDGLNRAPDNLLARTDQYTVEGESLSFPANAETSRATGSRYGGIRGYWLSEAAQITASNPKFRMVKLEPSQLGVLVYVTDKLLRNSPIALEQYLSRAATDEILFLTGDSIINGVGAGKPKGILAGTTADGTACRVTVAKETGQGGATIVKTNIDKMWSRLHTRSRANAVWFINQEIEPQLDNLNIAVGTGGAPVYLPPGGIADAPFARLKGRPVVPIEYCAALGTEGDIILADLSAYASGVQGGIETAMSMHLRFDYAESAFRFLFAVDGQPWLVAPITPFKGSATLSPFVTLATRS